MKERNKIFFLSLLLGRVNPLLIESRFFKKRRSRKRAVSEKREQGRRENKQRERERENEETNEQGKKTEKTHTESHLSPAPPLDRAHVLVHELGAVLEVVYPRLLVALLEFLAEELFVFWGVEVENKEGRG